MATNEERQNLLAGLASLPPEEWSVMVRYIGKELARTDEALLAEVICQEAERRAVRSREEIQTGPLPSDFIVAVLSEIGMRIVPA